MDNLIKIMSKSKLLEGFSEKECGIILSQMNPRYKQFSKDEVLFQDGDKVNYVGIVCSGKITTAKLDHEGNASLLYILEPPKLLGLEIAATPSQISSIIATTAEDASVVMFSYGELTTQDRLPMETRNRIMHNMLTLLANENMRRMYKIDLLCHKSLRERILTYLRFVARKKGTSSSFTIPFNRDQLAQYLNVNRSALSHELALMQREELISFKKNKFTLYI